MHCIKHNYDGKDYTVYHEGDCDYHDTETTVILIKFVRNQVS